LPLSGDVRFALARARVRGKVASNILVLWNHPNSTPSVLPTCFSFSAHPQGGLHDHQAASQIVFSQGAVFELSPSLVNLGGHLRGSYNRISDCGGDGAPYRIQDRIEPSDCFSRPISLRVTGRVRTDKMKNIRCHTPQYRKRSLRFQN